MRDLSNFIFPQNCFKLDSFHHILHKYLGERRSTERFTKMHYAVHYIRHFYLPGARHPKKTSEIVNQQRLPSNWNCGVKFPLSPDQV